MSRTTVHLVRHGEVFNPDGVLYGRLPGFELSAQGQAQAERVAAWTAGQDVAAVVASPLERAQQTAASIAAVHGVAVDTDERLVEAGNVFEGQTVAVGDGALRRPENWHLLANPFRPSWGEPYLEIAHRMLGAVHRVRTRADGRVAVCVSHQLPVWTLRRFVCGQRLWHNPTARECALGSVTSLVFTDETLVDLAYTEPAGTITDPVPGRGRRRRGGVGA